MVSHQANRVVAEAGRGTPGRAVVGRGGIHHVRPVGAVAAVVRPRGVELVVVGRVGSRRDDGEKSPLVIGARRRRLVDGGHVHRLAPGHPAVGRFDYFHDARVRGAGGPVVHVEKIHVPVGSHYREGVFNRLGAVVGYLLRRAPRGPAVRGIRGHNPTWSPGHVHAMVVGRSRIIVNGEPVLILY